jgi:hypothetical protein
VRDRGHAVGVESVNRILQHAVGVRDTFVLAQVFKPGSQSRISLSMVIGKSRTRLPVA